MDFTHADRHRLDALLTDYRRLVAHSNDPEWLEGLAQHLYDLSVTLRTEAFYADET